METRKFPRCRPASSKCARLSGPPELETRAGLPPLSSAISGAKLRASSGTFEVVPRTRTVSARCSPAVKGAESASRDNATKVIEKEGEVRFAQAITVDAGPGGRLSAGKTVSLV